MKRLAVIAFASGMSCVAALAIAAAAQAQQAGQPPETAAPANGQRAEPGGNAVGEVGRSDDEKAIRGVGEAFRQAFNAGNADAVAALYTEDAELIDERRNRIQGRPAIQDAYAALFLERKGLAIEIQVDSLKFLGPDVAKEEGHTRVKVAASSEPPAVRHFTVLYVKRGGRWHYSSVREELEPALSHHDRLAELEWMVGDWLDESRESVIHISCRWSPDKNFLLRDFTIATQGQPVMTVNQRIGWDPLRRQIRSWVFDSEGGYADGLWTRNGNQWVIKSTGVLADGQTATATNTLTQTGPNRARWSSTERTVGGEHVPDRFENVIVRRQPAPAAAAAPAAPAAPQPAH